MGVVLVLLGLVVMTGGALLLMPYSYAWMERLGWVRRWVFGIGLLTLGVTLVAAGQALD
jgi:hypothetical protein